MRQLRVILPGLLFFFALTRLAFAQDQKEETIDIQSDTGSVTYKPDTGWFSATNGVTVRWRDTVLVADSVIGSQDMGEVIADGRVRIQQGEQVWVGEHILYNFKTRAMETEVFRTGKSPVFASGKHLHGDLSNSVYTAESAFITTDDIADPAVKLKASSITIVPGKYVRARNAWVYIGGVPVFYFPYYSRALGPRANNFNFIPGYRSRFGPFLLTSYNWFLGEEVDGALHADYREKRGAAGGADVNLHLGRWGETTLKYYYLYDNDPEESAPDGMHIPDNRQRVAFTYDAVPFTNLNLKSSLYYQSDPQLLHDFFETEYRHNPQPATFIELNKFWSNFSLDIYAQKRVNDFYETLERLPDVRLTGYRQQLGPTPFYYESETSGSYLYRRFMDTNPPVGLDYSGVRADTFHQITLPYTAFGWLNIIPRAGGRFTYYTDTWGEGTTNNEVSRGVFNTGAEMTFKASRLWRYATNSLFQVDGLRHIVEPSVNYVFVPTPTHRPFEVPQYDFELPSLRLLPLEYPDYNSIDSIDSQNAFRFGLRNRFQTKREGKIENMLFNETFVDWRLDPNSGQARFSDVFSDSAIRPRSWITLESQVRYNIDNQNWRMLVHNLYLQPNDRWAFSVGHWYLRDDLQPIPTALSTGNESIRALAFLKLNENWAFRASGAYDLREDRMQEQSYTIYRDFRSWTAGVTARLRKNSDGKEDFTAAFTFSLKAAPKYKVGSDAVRPSQLLGY